MKVVNLDLLGFGLTGIQKYKKFLPPEPKKDLTISLNCHNNDTIHDIDHDQYYHILFQSHQRPTSNCNC